jgi:hypothetical protein
MGIMHSISSEIDSILREEIELAQKDDPALIVRSAFEVIEDFLSQGMSLERIAAALQKNDIKVTKGHLVRHLGIVREERGLKPIKRGRKRKPTSTNTGLTLSTTQRMVMIKSYFVDGDKGGVGKSFVSRCLVDSFINHEVSGMPKIDRLIVIDADPMNPDVVCDNGYKNETVNHIHVIGLQRPIKSEDDWLNLINELAETQINETDDIRLVFSLPSAAGLYITESVLSLMALMNPTPIWVMGIDASSTNQLEARVGKSPVFYQNGVVLINLKHGPAKAFEFWDKSKHPQDPLGWRRLCMVGAGVARHDAARR